MQAWCREQGELLRCGVTDRLDRDWCVCSVPRSVRDGLYSDKVGEV